MTGKRKRNCLDTQAAPSSVIGPEVDSPLTAIQKWGRVGWKEQTVFAPVSVARNDFRAVPVRRPRAESAAPAGQSIMQDGLASAARNGKIRMGDLTHPRNRRLSVAQSTQASRSGARSTAHQTRIRRTGTMVSMRWQGRRPVLWTHGQCLRFRTRTLGVGPRGGWMLLLECARTSASASAYCTVPAAVLSHGSHLTECDWGATRTESVIFVHVAANY